VAVVQLPLVTLQISTRSLGPVAFSPPPKKTRSPEDVAASKSRASLNVAIDCVIPD